MQTTRTIFFLWKDWNIDRKWYTGMLMFDEQNFKLHKNKPTKRSLKIESLIHFFLICNLYLSAMNGRVLVWKNNFYI